MVDKISISIIAFVIVFAISAGLLATGTIPEIFHTGSIANDTKYESKNQTKILVDFITLYLENIDKETKKTATEVAAAKATLQSQEETLKNQQQSLLNQEQIVAENGNITRDILKISQEHKDNAIEHGILQNDNAYMTKRIANLTLLTYELLKQHSINTTEKYTNDR